MTTTNRQAPVADDLFTWPSDDPQLIGARCEECAAVTFPFQGSCPRCGGETMHRHLLATHGTLWTFTTQGFLPKDPYRGTETEASFEGFGLGYVNLGDEVMVEARLTERDPDRLEIGQEMQLVIVPFRTEPDGTEVMMFAFAPTASRASDSPKEATR